MRPSDMNSWERLVHGHDRLGSFDDFASPARGGKSVAKAGTKVSPTLTGRMQTVDKLIAAGHHDAAQLLLDEINRELAVASAAHDATPTSAASHDAALRGGLNKGLQALVDGPATNDDEETD